MQRTRLWPTVEGKVSKEPSQKVHGKHASDGDIWDILHPSSGATEVGEKESNSASLRKPLFVQKVLRKRRVIALPTSFHWLVSS